MGVPHFCHEHGHSCLPNETPCNTASAIAQMGWRVQGYALGFSRVSGRKQSPKTPSTAKLHDPSHHRSSSRPERPLLQGFKA